MRMYDNLQNQLLRFERIVSGRFSPLTAPLPLIRFSDPLRSIFRSRFAYMLCLERVKLETSNLVHGWTENAGQENDGQTV